MRGGVLSKCAPAPTPGTRTAGATCQNDGSDCATGFYCKSGGSGGSGSCTASLAKGAKCGENGDFSGAQTGCADKRTCAGASMTSTGTFVAGTCSEWSNVGGPCVTAPPSAGFAQTGCMYGLACGSDQKCAKPPATGPCASDPGARCAGTAFCDEVDSTCQPVKADGAACLDDGQCQSVSCDDGTCTTAYACRP